SGIEEEIAGEVGGTGYVERICRGSGADADVALHEETVCRSGVASDAHSASEAVYPIEGSVGYLRSGDSRRRDGRVVEIVDLLALGHLLVDVGDGTSGGETGKRGVEVADQLVFQIKESRCKILFGYSGGDLLRYDFFDYFGDDLGLWRNHFRSDCNRF